MVILMLWKMSWTRHARVRAASHIRLGPNAKLGDGVCPMEAAEASGEAAAPADLSALVFDGKICCQSAAKNYSILLITFKIRGWQHMLPT